MIIGLIFWTSLYFLVQGLPVLFLKYPPRKADEIQLLIIILAVLETCSWLKDGLLWTVKNYDGNFTGYSVVHNLPIYLFYSVLIGSVILNYKSINRYYSSISNSIAIIGVHNDYKLTALYDVLNKLDMPYETRPGGISLTQPGVEIDVAVDESEIRFQVQRAIDKLYLNNFCKKYQHYYRDANFPLALNQAYGSLVFGVVLLLIFCFEVFFWKPS